MVVEHGINSPTDPERGAIWCKEKNPQTASKFLHRIVTHSLKVSVSETSSREDSSRRESFSCRTRLARLAWTPRSRECGTPHLGRSDACGGGRVDLASSGKEMG
jgi:hypothetical protein